MQLKQVNSVTKTIKYAEKVSSHAVCERRPGLAEPISVTGTDISARPAVGLALATATFALLGLQAAPASARGQPGEWDIDTAILFYSETDDRVQAIEPVVELTRNYGDDRKLVIKGVADALTGASPNGATASADAQTFTRPSGRATTPCSPVKRRSMTPFRIPEPRCPRPGVRRLEAITPTPRVPMDQSSTTTSPLV